MPRRLLWELQKKNNTMKTKKITSFILYFFVSITLIHAQNAIDKYYSKYADDPEFTTVVISNKMFELFAKIDVDDPENKEVLEAMSDLNGIKILTFESDDNTSNIVDYQDAIKQIGSEYEMLMSVDSEGEKVRFFILEEGEIIKELFMVAGGQGKLFLMSLVGDIDLKKMSKLSKSMDVGGMNYLENLDESEKK